MPWLLNNSILSFIFSFIAFWYSSAHSFLFKFKIPKYVDLFCSKVKPLWTSSFIGLPLLSTSDELDKLTQKEVSDFFPKETTDEAGNIKPMLAKQSDGLKPAAWERYWWASRKLDGVRCIFYCMLP